jgi:hypothetical protein
MLDDGAKSAPESMLRFRVVADELPAPETQCEITNATGSVIGHSDLGWREWRIAAEYEGRQHVQQEQFDYDIGRYTEMSAAGWLVLRAGRMDLRDGSRIFLARLRDALRSRGAPC